MDQGKSLICLAAAGALCSLSGPARADSARIAGLQDVGFGTLASFGDQSISQSLVVCSYKNNPQRLPYSVTASGSGTGGAFSLSSASGTLPFEVTWAAAPGQTGGTLLQPLVPVFGQGNGATGFDCPQQPQTASLTITLRGSDLSTARAGTYSGSLQITIAPE